MFAPELLDHFQNPRYAGVLPPPAVTVQVENPACGDLMSLSAQIEGGRLVRVGFQAKGCTASIAAGSALAEWLHERSLEEVRSFREEIIHGKLGGLPAASRHVAALCRDAVRAWLDAAGERTG